MLAAAALDLGTKLFRVKFVGDATSYPALLEAWRENVIGKAALRTWPADVNRAHLEIPRPHNLSRAPRRGAGQRPT